MRRTVLDSAIGSVAGYTCAIAFDPESKVGVILLRNYNGGHTPLDPIASQAVRAVVAERAASHSS